MTEVLDPYDSALAIDADGRLGELNRAGVLHAADVHVARRLGALGDEHDESVLVAAALAVKAVRAGSVCLDVATVGDDAGLPGDWVERVRTSPLTGEGRPLRLDLGRLYLDRYWRLEVQLAADLQRRASLPAPAADPASIQPLYPGPGEQRDAVAVAAANWTTVLCGGPGTGKTTTIARLLAVLLGERPGRVALAAPTGKAAARLQQAVQAEVATLPAADRGRLGALTASTVHRLLGPMPGRQNRFRHDRHNRLPYDVVVIDETSMMPLTLMARLFEALRDDTRVVLVGDPDQLASVEAGAVLADLVEGLAGEGIARLNTVHRFGGHIAELAAAIRAGDAETASDIVTGGHADISYGEAGLRDDAVAAATALQAAAERGDAEAALDALDTHRLLCAHRTGPFGVSWWTRTIESWLVDTPSGAPMGEWYAGRPLLLTENDYALGLFNGDTGVVVRDPDGTLRAAFRREGVVVRFAPSRLDAVQSVHAMTVHRSQGSQFGSVTLVLPPADSPLLTREMLYTAVTRAQQHLRIVGTPEALRAAVTHRAARASGLRDRLR